MQDRPVNCIGIPTSADPYLREPSLPLLSACERSALASKDIH